jgi:hypothetical protein
VVSLSLPETPTVSYSTAQNGRGEDETTLPQFVSPSDLCDDARPNAVLSPWADFDGEPILPLHAAEAIAAELIYTARRYGGVE